MKSKTKSNTRKKNYKRKNNTRKFRQSAGGIKIDGSNYPVDRYVFFKEEAGFGQGFKEPEIPAVVVETVYPETKGYPRTSKATIKVHRLQITKSKKVAKDNDKPKKQFPGVAPGNPIEISNSNQIRPMSPVEMDKLGILELLTDTELEKNKAIRYYTEKIQKGCVLGKYGESNSNKKKKIHCHFL